MADPRKSGVVALAIVAVLGVAGSVQAANPQFKSTSATVGNNGSLSVAVQIVGLGGNQSVAVSLSADADVTWGCVNKALKAPKAENKRTTSSQTGKSGNLTADRNGSVRGTLTTDPPTAPSSVDLNCPKSSTVELVSVTYKNIVVAVSSLGLSQNVSQVSRTFFQ